MNNMDGYPPPFPLKNKGFWRNLFANDSSPIFDILLGVIAPALCLVFDPFVFREVFRCTNFVYLGTITIFAYTAISLGIFTLLVWIFLGNKIRYGLGLISGVFIAGSVLACTVGIVLLPFSLLGLTLYCLGLAGLIPFLTSFVYLRNAIRALRRDRQQNPFRPMPRLIGLVLTGFLLILAVPAFAQWQAPQLFPQVQMTQQYDAACADQ